jgi:sulfide:quinone oxidoreductase
VGLPRLTGAGISGLPTDDDGFVLVDEHGRVNGLDNVYAAGDAVAWPVKQGGLAAQQADVVAESLAAWAGAPVRSTPFRPVLRGILLDGEDPVFLRADTRAGRDLSLARLKPLWWPPAKVAGRYLAPYLAAHGIAVPADPVATGPAGSGARGAAAGISATRRPQRGWRGRAPSPPHP